ncbi:membrane protein, partial [gut metagenome]
MVTFIVATFIIGYLCIAMESVIKVNKAAPALIMCAICWTLFMADAGSFIPYLHGEEFQAFLAES